MIRLSSISSKALRSILNSVMARVFSIQGALLGLFNTAMLAVCRDVNRVFVSNMLLYITDRGLDSCSPFVLSGPHVLPFLILLTVSSISLYVMGLLSVRGGPMKGCISISGLPSSVCHSLVLKNFV